MTLRQIKRLWSRLRPRSGPAAPMPTNPQDDAAGLGTAFGLEVSLSLQATSEPVSRPRGDLRRDLPGKPPRR